MEGSSAFDWSGARTHPGRPGVTYVRSSVSGKWVPVNTFDVPTAAVSAQPVESSGGVQMSDYFKSIMAGGAGLVAGAGWLMKRAPLMESFGRAIEEVGNDAVSYWDESLSEGAKAELAKQFVQKNADGEYEWGDAGVQTALLTGARSAMGVAGGLGVGAGLTKLLQVFANPLGRTALTTTIQAGQGAAAGTAAATRAALAAKKLKVVDTMLAATGFGVGEAAVATPDAGAAVERQVMQLPLEKLTKSERWREVYDSAEDMPEAERIRYATETIAKEASSQAGWQAGLTTMLLGGGAGAFYGRFLNRGAAAKLADSLSRFERTAAGRVASGAAVEGAQEFAQSGAQQLAMNRAVIDWADPSLDPLDQVLEQAVGGAVVGAPMGAGFSAMAGREPPAEVAGEFDGVVDAAAEQSFDPERKALPAPAQDPVDADFVVGREGVAQTPDQAARPRLPAPPARTDIEVGEEGVARRPGAGARLALPAPEHTDVLAVDSAGTARPQTRGEQGEAVARGAEQQDQRQEREVLGRQETGTNPGRNMPMRIKAAVGVIEPAAHADGETVATRYAVVELADLQASNDHQTGLKNRKYPQELQPRDRAPADIRANAMAPAKTFKPDALLQGGSTGEGTPIVAPDGFVESGNGRVMNLKAMGDRNALGEYAERVAARAAEVGIPPEAVAKFKQPVLVRVRQQFMEAAERRDFAERANAGAGGATIDPETASLLEEARGFIGGTIAGGGPAIDPNAIYDAGEQGFAEAQKLRDQNRTLPHQGNPEWFGRPDQGLTTEQANVALDKAKAGRKLGDREQRFVDYALEVARNRRAEGSEASELDADKLQEGLSAADRTRMIESAPTLDDLAAYEAMWRQEYLEAENEIDAIAERERAGEEAAGEPAGAAAAGAQNGDSPPTEGGGQAPGGADREGLTLAQQEQPRAAAAPATIPSKDLLGDDTRAAQSLSDETRRRDDARNSGQESVETGDAGDLFSQARQQQDLADASARQPILASAEVLKQLQEEGRTVDSVLEAERLQSRGYRVFTFHEQNEDSAEDISGDVERIGRSAPDSLILLPPAGPQDGSVADIEERIADGDSDATLIPHEVNQAEYEQQLSSAGWERETGDKGSVWKKGGAELFLRSQGPHGGVIVQWKAGRSVAPVIEDLGEKIGGARKDTAAPTGARSATEEDADDDGDDSPAWRSRFEVFQPFSGGVDADRWRIRDKRKKRGWSTTTFPTKEAAEAAIPLYAVAQKHSVRHAGEGKYEIARRVSDRKSVVVVEQEFDSRDAAMQYMAEHATEIIEKKTWFREEILARPDKVKRTGATRRAGDVGGKDFMEAFGFRGVEFGNWNNQSERQELLNHAYDGLHDLADVLGLPPKAISLNGDLALAFGARGHGLSSAAAHYERDYAVMNLTKLQGAGHLAHEWFHALDHYFGRQDGKAKSTKITNAAGDQVFDANSREKDYASHGFRMQGSGVREELRTAYTALLQGMFRKSEKYVEDTQRAAAFVARTQEALRQDIDRARGFLIRISEYRKTRNKPAPPEAMAKFDALADRLLAGDELATKLEIRYDKSKARGRLGLGTVRNSNDVLDAMGAVLKEVRGTTGFNAERSGLMNGIAGSLARHVERVQMLKDAEAGAEKERGVPTSFAMEAKRMDQGGATDYWTTEHEMAARAFSSYVEDKLAADGNISYFLSFGSDNNLPEYRLFKVRPFPEGEERTAINAAFDSFFGEVKTEPTDKGVRLYSKGVPASAAAKADPAVRKWLLSAAAELAGAAEVRVVDTMTDLRRELKNPDVSEAVYEAETGAVYLVAAELPTLERAQQVFAHEVFGHLAMEKHGDMAAGLRMVHAMHAAKHRVTTELWNEVTRRQPNLGRTEHAKEVIAMMAERGVRNSAMDRLIAGARALLRKIGVQIEYSENDLRAMIARAARALRREAATAADRRAAPAVAESVTALEVAEGKMDRASARAAAQRAEDALAGIADASGYLYSKRAPMSDAAQAAREAVMAGAAADRMSVKDRLRETVNAARAADKTAIRQGLVDFAASVERYERELNGGDLLDASRSIYKQVLATQNLGSVMTAVMQSGIPVWRDGSYQVEAGRKGLAAIFEPLTTHADGNLTEHFELYAAARRASRLIKEDRENLFTPEQIKAGMDLAKQYPALETVFNEWQAFNRQAHDMMQDAGLIDPDARALWERNDYVPFYRAMDDVAGVQGPMNKGGVANQRSGIKTLKGGENKLGNIIENMMMNVAHAVDSSYKNRAATMVADTLNGVAMTKLPVDWRPAPVPADKMATALRSLGVDVARMTAEQRASWGKVFTPAAPAGPNVVTVMRGGKPEYYEVLDPLLLRSMTAMRGNQALKQLDLFGFVTGAKRLLTNTVTSHPSFIVANFVRDTLSTWVQSPLKIGVLTGAYRGFRDVFKNDPDFVAIMAAGGGGGQIYDSDPAHIRALLMKKMPSAQVDGFLSTIVSPRKVWAFYRKVQNAAENANRLRVYRAALASGASQAEAVYQARDVLNFSLRGDHAAVSALAMSVPFLNARLQGLYRLQRGYKENRAAFIQRGLMLAGATLALLAVNSEDERYQELQEWDRDTYWHFWVGDQHFRVPRPFEVGALFAMVPERAVRTLLGEDDTRVLGQAIGRTVLDTFAFNPIPQLAKPVIEQYQNKLFFTGRPIIGLAQEGLKPEAQYTERTSPMLVEIAKAMPDAAPEWLRSPMRLEALVRGYLGSMGISIVSASDTLTRAGLGYPDAPSQPWVQHAFSPLSRFTRSGEPRSTKFTDELYRMAEEANEAAKTINNYVKQGRIDEAKAARIEYKDQVAARGRLNKLVANMRRLNQSAQRVMNDQRMTPDTKRERLDEINSKRNDIARLSAQFSDYF